MFSSICKYIIFTIGSVIISVSATFSVYHSTPKTIDECMDVSFSLYGSDTVSQRSSHTYSIIPKIFFDEENNMIPHPITGVIVNYTVIYQGKKIQHSTGLSITVRFDNIGMYVIQANIHQNTCVYKKELRVRVYKKIFTYIGSYVDEFDRGSIQNILENQILVHTVFLPEKQPYDIIALLEQNANILASAEEIFVRVYDHSTLVNIIHTIQKNVSDQQAKKIYIIDDRQKPLVKKLLATFSKNFPDTQLYVLTSQEIRNIVFLLSIGKLDYEDILKNSRLFFDKHSISYSLGYVIEFLLFNGLSLDYIVLIFNIIVCILIILIRKHVVGFPSFGVYYPIIFAYLAWHIGFGILTLLVCIALLSKVIIIIINSHINLLASTKIGLQLVVYIILCLLCLALLHISGIYTDFSIINNPLLFSGFVIVPIITSRLRSLSSVSLKKSIMTILLFFIISYICYRIMTSSQLQQFILLYPNSILLIVIGIVLLGRYTGLQVIEIIRFWPLIQYVRKKR